MLNLVLLLLLGMRLPMVRVVRTFFIDLVVRRLAAKAAPEAALDARVSKAAHGLHDGL